MIRTCMADGKTPGVCWQDEQTLERGPCHVPVDDSVGAKAAAMRAALRDGAAVVAHGDKELAASG